MQAWDRVVEWREAGQDGRQMGGLRIVFEEPETPFRVLSVPSPGKGGG